MSEEMRILIRGLKAVADLIDGSQGVAGLHLNGDNAPWEELQEGGKFESWLIDFDIAMTTVAEIEFREAPQDEKAE